MSLPYHIGNGWFGGFLPPIAFAIVAATGSIYSGLWYPVVVSVITLVIGVLFVHETRDVDIRSDTLEMGSTTSADVGARATVDAAARPG
jgi:phosphatidylserine synthase